MNRYEVDENFKKYLIAKGYKKTDIWKRNKLNRWLLGYGLISVPYIIYLVNLLGLDLNVLLWFSISFIISNPIGIYTIIKLKHKSSLVPKNRGAESIYLGDISLLYSYIEINKLSNSLYVNTYNIKYEDISEIVFNKNSSKLILSCGFNKKIIGSEDTKHISESKESKSRVEIPFYFENRDYILNEISKRSEVNIESKSKWKEAV